MDLLLKNLTWVKETVPHTGDIRIRRGKIKEIGVLKAAGKERVVDFGNHYLYPGLVNSHDHLEMNLYPRLGKPLYNNYTEWARDIYKPQESPVREIESVDLKLRLLWGGVKNLISGVTTVIHHNPWQRTLGRADFLVKVLKKYQWAHSLAFEKEKKVAGFSSSASLPFIIHAAEGIDALAHGEIQKLDQLHALRKNTVLIHAVGLSKPDIARIEETGTSIVWCPSSNLFMFGQTANVAGLKKKSRVGLGTDSTMTGSPSFFEEMRAAVKTGLASAQEVVEMSTVIPRRIFNLPEQNIQEGGEADFLIVPKTSEDYYQNLINTQTGNVTAVFLDGQFRFGDPVVMKGLGVELALWKFDSVEKAIACDMSKLIRSIQKQVDVACVKDNPLWQRIVG